MARTRPFFMLPWDDLKFVPAVSHHGGGAGSQGRSLSARCQLPTITLPALGE
ncbi:MAG: hypothetical protein MJE77_42840 [Proteobacteria bacterium]|nr:hypothetical protein [Pseudomonadota bacterium]